MKPFIDRNLDYRFLSCQYSLKDPEDGFARAQIPLYSIEIINNLRIALLIFRERIDKYKDIASEKCLQLFNNFDLDHFDFMNDPRNLSSMFIFLFSMT